MGARGTIRRPTMTAPDRHPAGVVGGRRPVPDRVLELVTDRMRIVADPMRVRIMWLLEETGRATVQELCDRVPCGYQSVSKHLRVLYGAGLVSRARAGNSVRYELADFAALLVVDKMIASVGAQLEEEHERFAGI